MLSTQQHCSTNGTSVYIAVFIVGHILLGIGACSIWTLVPAHLEDITDRETGSVYIGVYQCVIFAIAPALAFLTGNPILNTWVDIQQVCDIRIYSLDEICS